MTKQEELLDRLMAMLQVAPALRERTLVFKETSHEELCRAFSSWFSQLQLLFGEPVQVSLTHGVQEEGADIILDFPTARVKLGLQIKSYGDLQETGFQSKMMAQITYSNKHGFFKLIVVLCSDLTNPSQKNRTSGILSELSQIGDYAIPVTPEKAIVVLECFRKGEHPLSFIKGTDEVAALLRGLASALSDDSYEANVALTYTLRQQPPASDYPAKTHISFKPGISAIKGLDLIRRAQAGQPVTIPGELISSVGVFLDGQGRSLIPPGAKVDYFKIVPEIAKLPPCSVVARDPTTGDSIRWDNVQFVREKFDGSTLYLVSDDNPQPFQLSLVFDFGKQIVAISGHLDYAIADVRDALKFTRLMMFMYKSQKFELRGQSDELLVSSPEPTEKPKDVSVFDRSVELLENASIIQQRLGTRIPAPEFPTSYDLELSRKLRELVENGKIELQRDYSFMGDFTKSETERAVKDLREKGFIDIIIKVSDYRGKLLGQELSLGPARIAVPAARSVEDIASIEKRRQGLSETEHVQIQLVACGDEAPIAYLEGPKLS
jgi:hypothetical protein